MGKINVRESDTQDTSASPCTWMWSCCLFIYLDLFSPIRLSCLPSMDDLSGTKILKSNLREAGGGGESTTHATPYYYENQNVVKR